MIKGKRYWIPNLKPLVIHECFPEGVYEQCVAGMTWGNASLERAAAHISEATGNFMPEMFILTIGLRQSPREPFRLGIRLDNPFLKDHVKLLTMTDVPAIPASAEFLFYLFMAPQNCDALVGDLEERYKLIYKKFGRRRANFWYWKETVRSVGPIVWAWAMKLVLKPIIAVAGWAVAKGLIGHDSWLAALVELWKRIRL